MVFSIPVPKVNLFRRITRNYARQLQILPTAPLLPRRRRSYLPVNEVGDHVEVQTLEDLVDLPLSDIDGPVGQIIPSHNNSDNEHTNEDLSTDWTRDHNQNPETAETEPSRSGSSSSEEEEMANENVENNKNDNLQPWLLRDALAILGRQHRLPQHPEKLLPRFNPDSKESTEDHIQKFLLANCLMSVQAKDVVCRLFPYTFEGKESTWYFSLLEGCITSWNQFHATFLEKFGEDKTPTILALELSRIMMDGKEKIKDLNQHFLTLKNKIPIESRPPEGVVVEFYTPTLPQMMAMFVKQTCKISLQDNFTEAIRIEKDLVSLKGSHTNDKPYSSRVPVKTHANRRDQNSFDMEGLQRMVKQLYNKIIDLKKTSGESTLGRGFFIFPDRKHLS